MYEHRIRTLKTWYKLHQEQSLKLNKSIQEEWKQLGETESALEVWELQHKVARAVERQAEALRTDYEDH